MINYLKNRKYNIKILKQIKITLDNKHYYIYLVDNKAIAIRIQELLIPALTFLLKITSENGIEYLINNTKFVIVDEGAIVPICRGADVMAPGIKKYSDFKKNDIVVVIGETSEGKRIPIAVARSLIDSYELNNKRRGKVLETLHYINDKLWQILSKY